MSTFYRNSKSILSEQFTLKSEVDLIEGIWKRDLYSKKNI